MITGSLLFLGFLVALSLLRIALVKPLQKTLWFKFNSVRLALWASGWAVAVMGVSGAVKLKHPAISALAFAPIVSILLSMFLLVFIQVPAFWWASIRKFGKFFKKDQ